MINNILSTIPCILLLLSINLLNKLGLALYLSLTLYWILFYRKIKRKTYEELAIQNPEVVEVVDVLEESSTSCLPKPLLTIAEIDSLIQEDNFLSQCSTIISKHFHDESFNVPTLAGNLFIARATLYREISKRTGRTAITFIKIIRLLKANDLLMNTELPISNIAYEVGFKAPSHFSTSYKKEYGCTPKQMRKRSKPENLQH